MDFGSTLFFAALLLMALFMSGLPIFVCFMIFNVGGILFFFGTSGFGMFANSIFETATTSSLLAVPLFILMGELLFKGGTVDKLYGSLDCLLKATRSRLLFLSIALSTILGALSGTSMGIVAMLGRTMLPRV